MVMVLFIKKNCVYLYIISIFRDYRYRKIYKKSSIQFSSRKTIFTDVNRKQDEHFKCRSRLSAKNKIKCFENY